MSVPHEHLVESQKLTADGLVSIYEITLRATASPQYVRFTDGVEITWQGKLYEQMACQFSGATKDASDERSRPTLRVMNPAGIFNMAAQNGNLDGALVERRRLLRSHLEANVNISETTLWRVGRVKEIITGQAVTLELRSLVDGPEQLVPARKYMPPEFPFVTL